MQFASTVNNAEKTSRKVHDDQIYDQMFAAILQQRLTPGTKLSEDTLGEIFGVSRTVIRKILQRLAYEKVVQILPNRGAFVAEPSAEEAREVLYARRVVEAAIMRLAVKSHSKEDLKTLERNLEAEAKTIEAGQHSDWVALSGNFHLLLAEIASNRTLADYLRELVSRTSLIHIQYQSNKIANQSCSCDEHADIIEAIRERDEDKAVALMERHIEEIEKSLNLDGRGAASDLYEIFGASGGVQG
ncbi:GntR family transcriptional regulator [Sneathiella glossodoripedis]|uniref:GntR family transcriptional regulator n=1 Tax=Sneathiella glossodoripedis TaxID=418853 RepID=UPI00046EE31F|nr:GntR family transcriptional regulator [Sneathiella glossodoripedis]